MAVSSALAQKMTTSVLPEHLASPVGIISHDRTSADRKWQCPFLPFKMARISQSTS
jgi:hypothetical protein